MTVYFYCSAEEGNLQEDVITLAEGLRELGVRFFGSCNYWLQSTRPDDFLIRFHPDVRPDDCDIVVVSYTWPMFMRMGTFDVVRRHLPAGLFRAGRNYRTVYMDNHDGHRTVSWESDFRQFDLILRSKLNRHAWYPENMRPWVLGYTERIRRATADAPAVAQRRPTLLVNFGASHPFGHGTRRLASRRFESLITPLLELDRTRDDLAQPPADPYDALMWRQTGGRFCRAYYERLKHSQAVSCFCGELIPPAPYRDPETLLVGGNRAKVRRAFYQFLAMLDPRPPRSVQWDSFRYWEALTAGCATFNLDLDHYGAELPVMPENGTHYFGVDLARPRRTVEQLLDDPTALSRVGAAGRAWALEHYSPMAMAARFLRLVAG